MVSRRGACLHCPAGEARRETPRAYKTVMIDQGFCFNAGNWDFPDAPLRGLYARNRVYEGVTGMQSFAPWLELVGKPHYRGCSREARGGNSAGMV